MKRTITTTLIFLFAIGAYAQHLEVDGEAKINTMRRAITSDLNIVRLTNGTLAVRKYRIGDFVQGGIVFYVDETGEHGLVCTKSDIDTVRWSSTNIGPLLETQAKGNGPFSGEMNTAIAISSQAASGDDGNPYAARVCSELKITEGEFTYGDWYLPSKDELSLMNENKDEINATATDNGGVELSELGNYWSSTEISANDAYRISFVGGVTASALKTLSNKVRAIRAF